MRLGIVAKIVGSTAKCHHRHLGIGRVPQRTKSRFIESKLDSRSPSGDRLRLLLNKWPAFCILLSKDIFINAVII
jgi:hypothetical protein